MNTPAQIFLVMHYFNMLAAPVAAFSDRARADLYCGWCQRRATRGGTYAVLSVQFDPQTPAQRASAHSARSLL